MQALKVSLPQKYKGSFQLTREQLPRCLDTPEIKLILIIMLAILDVSHESIIKGKDLQQISYTHFDNILRRFQMNNVLQFEFFDILLSVRATWFRSFSWLSTSAHSFKW